MICTLYIEGKFLTGVVVQGAHSGTRPSRETHLLLRSDKDPVMQKREDDRVMFGVLVLRIGAVPGCPCMASGSHSLATGRC